VYAPPTLEKVIEGGPNGWNITGPAVIATFGNPRSNPAGLGGWGFLASEVGPAPFPSAPVANPAAAAFVNNITRAIDAFQELPGSDETLFTPGELAALLYVLPAAADNIPNPNPNPALGFVDQVPNPDQNINLKNYLLQPSTPNALKNPRLEAADPLATGRVPVRTTNVAYTDAVETGGSPTGGFYINQGGAAVNYGGSLAPRNKIFFDFNGDGVRDLNDIPEAYLALRDRETGSDPAFAWNAPIGSGLLASQHSTGISGNDAIIEVLGDATGDGNFDRDDMRYFADGLAVDSSTGNLNRFLGFAALDAQEANFFGIASYSTGASYKAGDAAADIAGSLQTPGFVPNGHDGVIDGADIDYVYANFGNWTIVTEAQNMDLSADMNGDLIVDLNDVCFIVNTVLGTSFGDVNLDGVVDAADIAIINANLGQPGGWAQGDMNGDGVVDALDLAIAQGTLSFGCDIACTGDIADSNGTLGSSDGQVDFGDLLALFGLAGPCPGGTPGCTGDIADSNGTLGASDGQVDFGDLLALFGLAGPCN
jgi:hypothetical protein